jgi:hypothetical protein
VEDTEAGQPLERLSLRLKAKRMARRFILWSIIASAAFCSMATTGDSQLFVSNYANGNAGTGSIGAYTTSGAPINPALISGLTALTGLAISGDKLFVASGQGIGEYTLSGTPVNPSLISGLFGPQSMTISGPDLYVVTARELIEAQKIEKYTTSGATVNADLIPTTTGSIQDIAVSGDKLFVATPNNLMEFTTSGVLVNPSLISGFDFFPSALAVSSDKLFVADSGNDLGEGTIGEYTLAGTPVNPTLISGLTFPFDIAVSGNDLFVLSSVTGTIGEYTTTGATVNASLITGLSAPRSIVIAPASVPDSSSTWTLLLLSLTAVFGVKSLLRKAA